MSVRPYQFEPLKKCSENAEEDCRDKGETSNPGKNNERNLLLLTRLSYC